MSPCFSSFSIFNVTETKLNEKKITSERFIKIDRNFFTRVRGLDFTSSYFASSATSAAVSRELARVNVDSDCTCKNHTENNFTKQDAQGFKLNHLSESAIWKTDTLKVVWSSQLRLILLAISWSGQEPSNKATSAPPDDALQSKNEKLEPLV